MVLSAGWYPKHNGERYHVTSFLFDENHQPGMIGIPTPKLAPFLPSSSWCWLCTSKKKRLKSIWQLVSTCALSHSNVLKLISKILSLFGQTKNRYFSWRILLPCWIGGHQGTGLWLLVKSLHWKTIHKKTLILESTWKLSINVCDGYLLDIDGSKAYCQLWIDMCLQGWFQLVGRPVLSVAGKMFTYPIGAMYPAHPHLAYASIVNQLNVVNSVIGTQLEIEQLYLWITWLWINTYTYHF